ncbi:MAG: HAMP domain-containing protein [Deltaproteobacteria bacterium]|nr:HAMP domain-containing protein [Deltaproteobacteria bacterium]
MLLMGVAVVIGLFAMGLIINRIESNVKAATALSETRDRQLGTINKILEAQLRLRLAATDSIVGKDEGNVDAEHRQIVNETSEAISNNLKILAELADSAEESRRIRQLNEDSRKFVSSIETELFTLIEKKLPAGARSEAEFARIDGTIDRQGVAINTALAGIKASLEKKILDTRMALHSYLASSTIIGYTVFGIILVVLTTAFYFFARGIVVPLRATIDMLAELGRGHINQRLHLTRSDEIGQMAAAMDTFADSLQQDIVRPLQQLAEGNLTFNVTPYDDQDVLRHAIRKVSIDLNDIIAQIQSAGEQINSASGQVADSSQSLSQGATETAASLEEISSSMNEMTSQTTQSAENANQASQLANAASTAAANGNQRMDEMITAMNEINEAGQNISKIIKVIDEIAFQTNLLALNAAVEAARAGQHGKGFAVVAEEVRNLAARSARAAAETSELIEGSVGKTHNGSQIAEQTSVALQEIVGSITKVTDLVAEIAAAGSEQAQGIAQVNVGLGQIDQSVQQSTATAEESAAAAEELSSQAEQLKHMLSRFTLAEAQAGQFAPPRPAPPVAPPQPAVAKQSIGWEGMANRPKQKIKLDDDEFGKF